MSLTGGGEPCSEILGHRLGSLETLLSFGPQLAELPGALLAGSDKLRPQLLGRTLGTLGARSLDVDGLLRLLSDRPHLVLVALGLGDRPLMGQARCRPRFLHLGLDLCDALPGLGCGAGRFLSLSLRPLACRLSPLALSVRDSHLLLRCRHLLRRLGADVGELGSDNVRIGERGDRRFDALDEPGDGVFVAARGAYQLIESHAER